MKKFLATVEQVFIIGHLLKWTGVAVPLSLITGSLVAFFLWSLDMVTRLQWAHGWLFYGLPLAGISVYFLYYWWGRRSTAGNNLIMAEIHEPGGGVPAGMTPLVLFGTLVTHLFGGSAGREGTAVQMGGSMASLLGRWFGLSRQDTRIILMMGIAGGFGAVFGTPLAGAIFALEVLAIGVIKYEALVPCLIAAILSDGVCSAWGIHHTPYQIGLLAAATPGTLHLFTLHGWLLFKVIAAGITFGLAAWLFVQLSEVIRSQSRRLIKTPQWLIPFTGGCIIILLTFLLGTRDYLGLGVEPSHPGGASITTAFFPQGVDTWSWWWKLLFTAITLATGFKGGEVTPLFFIGAALGNTLAVVLGAPVDLMAGLGFIAVFAAATNTPIACTLMGVELFGTSYVLYFGVACFTAYYFSGHSGIYSAQRVAVSKPREPKD